VYRVINGLDFPRTERRRLTFAHDLDDAYPEICWAKLVMWALGYEAFDKCFYQNCDIENSYCGKCARLKAKKLKPET
jgi:hypothetical protein